MTFEKSITTFMSGPSETVFGAKLFKNDTNVFESRISVTQNFEISQYNDVFARMIYCDELVNPLRLSDIIVINEDFEFLIQRLRVKESTDINEILLKRFDGKIVWCKLHIKALKKGTSHVRELCFLDISNQKLAAENAKKSEISLEKISTELDRFIYSASHDLRSPVTSMLGLVNIMRLEVRDQNVERYITMFESSLNRLEYFINGLTLHSKNSNDSIQNEKIPFKDLISNILNAFKAKEGNYQRIVWSIEVYELYIFYSDINRCTLILTNLIKNAIDYIDLKKSVNVVSVRVETKPEKVTIEIFDNGIGISSLHIDHVFNMFYRATDISKGSGLGLYTAREAAVKIGGSIAIKSSYGIGTSLTVDIPNSTKGKLINKKKILRDQSVT